MHDPMGFLDTQTVELKTVCKCTLCGKSIVEGDDYYKIGDENYCEKCIDTFKVVAESDDEWFGDD